ncbi:hypothetical protein GCM10010532_071550 [Dactylosporangium siamense]|uniref:Uncharacterized protein n=2 Tax=Dactylosporangium siamense TaxID=685454 RepID=A0A919PNJ0_9ACTN|nr:hypothetical protein Dsi01nite_052750 [Dactylosporangium siamense]
MPPAPVKLPPAASTATQAQAQVDIDALTAGQILTVSANDLTNMVLSSADFEATAKRRC